MSLIEEKKVPDLTEDEKLAEAESLAKEALRMAEEAKEAADRLALLKAALSTDASVTTKSVAVPQQPSSMAPLRGEEKVDITTTQQEQQVEQVQPSSSMTKRGSPPVPEFDPREQAVAQSIGDPPAEKIAKAESTIATTTSEKEKAELVIERKATEEILEPYGGVNSPGGNCCDDEPRLPQSCSLASPVAADPATAEHDAQIAATKCDCVIL